MQSLHASNLLFSCFFICSNPKQYKYVIVGTNMKRNLYLRWVGQPIYKNRKADIYLLVL